MSGDGALILHHYDPSPFSEKVRVLLGARRLAWRSVVTPAMLPKPDLTPLTGGYRRAPVLQIGADVFIDSQAALREIARRAPAPEPEAGAPFPVGLWSDRLFFPVTVGLIFGTLGDRVDPAFVADRERMSGRPFDLAAMAAAVPALRGQWRAHAALLEEALEAAAAPFLSGARPGLVDAAAYMNVWWLGAALPPLYEALSADLPAVRRWRSALAAVGHGRREEMTGAEALEAARASEPAALAGEATCDAPGLSPGDLASVAADDYGRDPVVGRLVAATPLGVILARETADLGRIHLHFPRTGYVLSPA